MLETITLADLEGACSGQQKLFRETFGASCPVSAGSLRRAREAGLDVEWVLPRVLSPQEYADYRRQLVPMDAYYPRQSSYSAYSATRWRDALYREYQRQVDAVLVSLISARPASTDGGRAATTRPAEAASSEGGPIGEAAPSVST